MNIEKNANNLIILISMRSSSAISQL